MKQTIMELTRAIERLADAVQGVKEGKEENSPTPPIRRKPKKPTTTTTTRARARFVKPTVDEVAAHVREKGYTFDPVSFWNYYESNGWKVGKNSMKDWKASVRTWEKDEKPKKVSSFNDFQQNRYDYSDLEQRLLDN